MGALGIILTVGIVGAVAAAGYAVYRNADKIGGAFSRGVETQLTVPLGNYLNNLWSDFTTSTANSITQAVVPWYPWQPSQPAPTPTPTPTAPVPAPYVPLPTPTAPTPTAPTPTPTPTPTAPYQPPQPTSFKTGYYYINFAGAKYDYQVKLSSAGAKELSAEAFSNPYDSFQNIKYLGQSQLGKAGLELFAKSQNYL